MNKKSLINTLSIVALAIILLLIPVFLKSVYWVSILALVGINILLVSSLRTIKLLDHISLGHVGFTCIGAYGSALLVMKVGLPFWLALIAAGLMSGIVALALSYPFLKVKGMYFAILTLLTAETFRLIAYYWRDLTGGTYGLTRIPSPSPVTIPGVGTLTFNTVHSYYYIILIVVFLSLLVIYKIEHSHLSFKWQAIRDADNLAYAVGINVAWYKMVNFAIACFFAGIAGALFAHFQHNLSADPSSRFGVMSSIYLVVYMVVGGEGRFAGPIIGTFVIMLIAEFVRPLGQYQTMLIGAIAILVILFMPGGLVGLLDQVKLGAWRMKLLRKTERVQDSSKNHTYSQKK